MVWEEHVSWSRNTRDRFSSWKLPGNILYHWIQKLTPVYRHFRMKGQTLGVTEMPHWEVFSTFGRSRFFWESFIPTIFNDWHTQSVFWPFRVMRRHDLTNKRTMAGTFIEHHDMTRQNNWETQFIHKTITITWQLIDQHLSCLQCFGVYLWWNHPTLHIPSSLSFK